MTHDEEKFDFAKFIRYIASAMDEKKLKDTIRPDKGWTILFYDDRKQLKTRE